MIDNTFSNIFIDGVAQANRPELFGRISILRFGDNSYVGGVYRMGNCSFLEYFLHKINGILANYMPAFLVKYGMETIWTWSFEGAKSKTTLLISRFEGRNKLRLGETFG